MTACKKCGIIDLEFEINEVCGHPICHQCLCSHVETQKSAKIYCPVNKCTAKLQDSIIRKCLSNHQTESYDIWCLSPKTVKCLIENCWYHISFEEMNGHFICEICKQPNCLTCRKLHEKEINCDSIINYSSIRFEEAGNEFIRLRRRDLIYSLLNLNDLLPNSEKFDCPVCGSFFLPRKGVCLRNCMHNFCSLCLETYIGSVKNFKNMNCPLSDCGRPLTERECRKLLGKEYTSLSLDIVKPKMSHCQKPECTGMWDFGSYKGKYKCPVCNKENCASCGDIHEGQTCEIFRTTKRFIEVQKFKEKLDKENRIICQNCGLALYKKGGCNALRCSNCRLQVCAYSGLEIGPKGCKCTNSKRCVVGCTPGCIPEGSAPYEKKLAEYFWKN